MKDLLNYIPIGESNAIHLNALAEELELSQAKTKALIRNARKEGAEICSGQAGYWIAENESEKQKFIKSMYKSSFTRLNTCKNIKKSLGKIPGQMDIFDIWGKES